MRSVMTRTSLTATCISAAVALCVGCAPSIKPEDFGFVPDAATPIEDALVPTGPVTTGMNSDGSFTTIVDATALDAWTYIDFETRAQATETDPWDLRFQRFHISANGGVSGTGGVEVVRITDRAFLDVSAAPATGWVTDAPDSDDTDSLPDYVFEQGDDWYAYDFMTHVLTPRPWVWVVRPTGGAPLKLSIQKYYDSAGSPAWITFRWAPL